MAIVQTSFSDGQQWDVSPKQIKVVCHETFSLCHSKNKSPLVEQNKTTAQSTLKYLINEYSFIRLQCWAPS